MDGGMAMKMICEHSIKFESEYCDIEPDGNEIHASYIGTCPKCGKRFKVWERFIWDEIIGTEELPD